MFALEFAAAIRIRDLHRAAEADRLARSVAAAAAEGPASAEYGKARRSRVGRAVAAVRSSASSPIEAELSFVPKLVDYPAKG